MLKAGFVSEQTLGHVGHGRSLRRLLGGEPGIGARQNARKVVDLRRPVAAAA
jgi:hypothetical protein